MAAPETIVLHHRFTLLRTTFGVLRNPVAQVLRSGSDYQSLLILFAQA
jgi:hypothetical protein